MTNQWWWAGAEISVADVPSWITALLAAAGAVYAVFKVAKKLSNLLDRAPDAPAADGSNSDAKLVQALQGRINAQDQQIIEQTRRIGVQDAKLEDADRTEGRLRDRIEEQDRKIANLGHQLDQANDQIGELRRDVIALSASLRRTALDAGRHFPETPSS